ncbi:LysR substrate-binding domain-containing protein [Marinobacter sp. X15-166B]|uniref:LysR substrate-binding domain-containing protein n=1 Tax=Marinobacter sp. X15-166B TaxID=1897620 RepID=UPI00085C697C|nr:LysR substrate-binding domain-containing protein [Marinobacter sp. X15-166B]OEY66676.1 LysR family transcriptional regulator [Marinobacter sp. X15-166B]
MVRWDGIREFVAVVEAGSFTAAGQRLEMSTAQVSRQVGALEERLASRLLHRTTRTVSVTETGQLYYQHCRQLLDGLEEAERVVTNLQDKPKGRLRLTAPISYGEGVIAPLINDFAIRYAELDVDLVLTNQRLDLLSEGLDLAIRIGQLEDSTLVARKLGVRTRYVCASATYLETYGTPYSLSELEQHNCLRGGSDYWRFQEDGKASLIRVQGRTQCNSGWALVDAAKKGMGLVQLPDYYVQALIETGRLIPVLENYRERKEVIWAVYPHNRHLSTKVRMLVEFLAASLSGSE